MLFYLLCYVGRNIYSGTLGAPAVIGCDVFKFRKGKYLFLFNVEYFVKLYVYPF